MKQSMGGKVGSDVPGETPVWAEPETEQFLQLWRGVRAGQGSMLEESSTAGPHRSAPNSVIGKAPDAFRGH